MFNGSTTISRQLRLYWTGATINSPKETIVGLFRSSPILCLRYWSENNGSGIPLSSMGRPCSSERCQASVRSSIRLCVRTRFSKSASTSWSAWSEKSGSQILNQKPKNIWKSETKNCHCQESTDSLVVLMKNPESGYQFSFIPSWDSSFQHCSTNQPPCLDHVSPSPHLIPPPGSGRNLSPSNYGSRIVLGTISFPFREFFFGSAFSARFLAICSILELEAAISAVFATFWSWNLSFSIESATF